MNRILVFDKKKIVEEGTRTSLLTQEDPIGLFVLRPGQPNRAFAILEEKLYQEGEREPFIFPLKAKSPEVVLEA